MTDEELPENAENEERSADTGDLPPPSTFAGRTRKDGAETGHDEASDPGESEEVSDADLQEDPPSEFEFDDEEEDALDDDAELEADADEQPGAPAATPAGMTVEADTLTLSDIEAAREAAHAGLTRRAQKSSFSQVTTSTHRVEPKKEKEPEPFVPLATSASGNGVGDPPKRRMGWRFVAAAFVIVSSMAAATAVSFLLFLSDIAKGLNDESLASARSQLASVEGGDPQTILILGSDKRTGTEGDPGRSDTAMLLRVEPDPDKPFLSVMSLPRDLEVPIPGYGTEPQKLNAAYTLGEQEKAGGGPELAIQTIKAYMGIDINHVVNVDFGGFLEAVNAIDCVYIDVDRHYEHSNEGLFGEDLYAEIDVEAGYTKLCGFNALQYVRYRHEDNDLVRGARQQDFVREARQRIPPAELLPVFGRGDELIDIFTKNTASDINDASTIVEMLKTFAAVRNAPVRQVSIGQIQEDGGVEATDAQVEVARNQFLGNDLDNSPVAAPEPDPEPKPDDNENEPKSDEPQEPAGPTLIPSADTGQQIAAGFGKFMESKETDLPIFYPSQIVEKAETSLETEDSRAAALPGPNDKTIYYMYKFVIPFLEEGSFGSFTSYYGLSGTNWDDPPILRNPSEFRTIDGREYMLFYEDDRLRLVAWQTSKGSYWVNNTLTQNLSEDEMLAVATSAQELGE